MNISPQSSNAEDIFENFSQEFFYSWPFLKDPIIDLHGCCSYNLPYCSFNYNTPYALLLFGPKGLPNTSQIAEPIHHCSEMTSTSSQKSQRYEYHQFYFIAFLHSLILTSKPTGQYDSAIFILLNSFVVIMNVSSLLFYITTFTTGQYCDLLNSSTYFFFSDNSEWRVFFWKVIGNVGIIFVFLRSVRYAGYAEGDLKARFVGWLPQTWLVVCRYLICIPLHYFISMWLSFIHFTWEVELKHVAYLRPTEHLLSWTRLFLWPIGTCHLLR